MDSEAKVLIAIASVVLWLALGFLQKRQNRMRREAWELRSATLAKEASDARVAREALFAKELAEQRAMRETALHSEINRLVLTNGTDEKVPGDDPVLLAIKTHPVFVEIEPMMVRGDWGSARSFLQKIAYGIHEASDVDQRIFRLIMTLFAALDPMYQQCIKYVVPIVERNPGIRQTALYPHMAAAPDVEHARYVLYFAHELGHIVRRKKGNGYEVFLPGQPMPEVKPKATATRKPKRDSNQEKVDMTATNEVHSRERSRQLERFFTAHLGDGWQSGSFVYLNFEQITAALWPMFDVFKAHQTQLQNVPYSSAYEAEADQALALLAEGGTWSASQPSAGAWRVLHERHTQSITVAAANAASGNTRIVPVPEALASEHYRIAAMLFLQWAMVLVLPPAVVPNFGLPAGSAPSNLLQH